jgi:hypothetical protein
VELVKSLISFIYRFFDIGEIVTLAGGYFFCVNEVDDTICGNRYSFKKYNKWAKVDTKK